jgi:biofilm PGA synthesis protein PgaA
MNISRFLQIVRVKEWARKSATEDSTPIEKKQFSCNRGNTVQWMKRAESVVGLFSILIGVLIIFSPDPLLASKSSLHEQAVAVAREGNYEEALQILQREFKADPDNLNVLYDYLTILSWAGYDEEVLLLMPRISENQAPAYVLEAAAKSFRNLKNWNRAESLYLKGNERFPDRPAFCLGLIYTLADSGRLQESASLAEKLVERYPGQAEPELAAAYVAAAGKNYTAALARYQKILEKNPGNKLAKQMQIRALASLGAPWLAEELSDREEGLLTPLERLRLRSDQAALAVRWGTYGNEGKGKRFIDTDRALALLESNREMARELGAEALAYDLQARFDRLVALRNRVRMQEAAD